MIVVSLPVFLPQVISQVKPKKRKLLALPLPLAEENPSASSEIQAIDRVETEVVDDSVSERTQYFTTAKNLLITGSNAVERLMSSYKGKTDAILNYVI